MNLKELLTNYGDVPLEYVGTIYGDDHSVLTGKDWIEAIEAMFGAYASQERVIDSKLTDVEGFYVMGEDIWYYKHGFIDECVWKVYPELSVLLSKMLKENTGKSFLDSGDAYGRHWQENQAIEFDQTPDVTFDLRVGEEIVPIVNVYHFLMRKLEIDDLCREFNERFEVMDDWDSDIYGVSSDAWNWLLDLGFDAINTINTYNGESLLSQVLQYTVIRGSDEYVLLQVHNGCDVRGGYTDAKMFKYNDMTCNVGGEVVYPDGTVVEVDTWENGYCITDSDGNEIVYEDGMQVNLWLW